ncbi:MOSC domain-containing protein [Thiohalomonas denitrificans]|uniref:MOSC domain-containing protein n=1 Tax=Thiohalomonas denitrificans TaxID=415747 RepID=UPI0026F32A91|nr:MOSC domain-containing protein [Thiohalomonas denitrificans]
MVNESSVLPSVRLLGLRIGRTESFGPRGEPSAIRKQPVRARIPVTRLGLAGDEQGDRRHHGGLDKAVHHYPAEHYATWQMELPELAPRMETGGFGENLSTSGLDEQNICVGDIFRLGHATLQVSQARQPCWKLNVRFGLSDMARRVQDSGRTGWYYRVLEKGEAGPDDSLVLIERLHPDWTLARILRTLHHDGLDREALASLVGLEALAPGWRALAKKRLNTGAVEDGSRRLNTPT